MRFGAPRHSAWLRVEEAYSPSAPIANANSCGIRSRKSSARRYIIRYIDFSARISLGNRARRRPARWCCCVCLRISALFCLQRGEKHRANSSFRTKCPRAKYTRRSISKTYRAAATRRVFYEKIHRAVKEPISVDRTGPRQSEGEARTITTSQ